MAATASPYARSYNSFSGVDIKGVFANKVIAELQAISYSVTRENAPIYTMGSADPRSYSRGKRGIAGTLIFVVFDRHAVLATIGGYAADGGLMFQSDIDDVRPAFKDPNSAMNDTSVNLTTSSSTTPADTVQNQESPLSSVGSDQELATAWYVDQLPPFDITLAAANEYGALAVMRVFGVELLNEGYGVSIDDIVSEQQHTYVARTIIGWTPIPSANAEIIASQGGVSTSS
jgi:hypothetical protein